MKKLLLFSLFLILSFNIFAQYSITDSAKILTNKEIKYIEKVIEYQLSFYKKVFPKENIQPSDVKLHIYTDITAYLMMQKELYGSVRIGLGGFYSRKNKEAVVCKDKKEKTFLHTCYHELSHFFTNTYFEAIPIWLNEGLAVYFASLKVSDKNVQPQENHRCTARVKTMIDIRDINIKDFMTWSHPKFKKMAATHDSYGYALGYSIVNFLMKKDPDFLVSYIRLLKEGKSSEEAMEKLYTGGFIQFEKDFLAVLSK